MRHAAALTAALTIVLAAPAAAQAARHPCWPAGSKTLARSQHARVYIDRAREQRYGCLYSRGRPVQLDTEHLEENIPSDAGPPFVFADRFVAFPSVYQGQDGTEDSAAVLVVNLRTGNERFRFMNKWPVHSTFVPSNFTLVLRRNGAAAWLAEGTDFSTIDYRRTSQVLRSDAGGRSRLDQGDDLTDLKLCNSGSVCWKRGGATQTAPLR